jgi:hypothetical protein
MIMDVDNDSRRCRGRDGTRRRRGERPTKRGGKREDLLIYQVTKEQRCVVMKMWTRLVE